VDRRQEREPRLIGTFGEIGRNLEQPRPILDFESANASELWPKLFSIGGKALCRIGIGDLGDSGIGEHRYFLRP